jgi:hypothetical protein
MTLWLDLARIAATGNLVLLGILGWVWSKNYRQHQAQHTLGLLVFAAFLVIQNFLWLYYYVVHPGFIGWFVAASPDLQIGITLLCGLELAALLFLTRLTLL